MRAKSRTKQIMCVAYIRHPVTDRLVDGVLQGLCSRFDRPNFRAEQFHAEDIWLLPRNVYDAHVDYTIEPQQCGGSCRSDSMLTRPGLCNDPPFPHSLHQ